jgi:anti-sigma regulatory factor (Ser/Thr protein kinase)
VTRLLPWIGEAGQPAYLSADTNNSFVSRFADGLESVQLAMAERLLHSAELAWADRAPGADMTSVVPHLCHALRDAVRVARSRGGRLPDVQEDDRSALADSALEREVSLPGAGGTPPEGFPLTIPVGPWSVAYRWPADPICVGTARRLLLRHLGQWDMTALADTAGLVLSELATNSVRHASGPDGRLIETRFQRLPDGTLRIEVHDADQTKPERREPSADADSGRGLLLVDTLTGGRWGVSDREGIGKLTWAECTADSGVTEVTR